jgi:hypothetical protein
VTDVGDAEEAELLALREIGLQMDSITGNYCTLRLANAE